MVNFSRNNQSTASANESNTFVGACSAVASIFSIYLPVLTRIPFIPTFIAPPTSSLMSYNWIESSTTAFAVIKAFQHLHHRSCNIQPASCHPEWRIRRNSDSVSQWQPLFGQSHTLSLLWNSPDQWPIHRHVWNICLRVWRRVYYFRLASKL